MRRVRGLAACRHCVEFELIQASCSKEEIDHSKPIYLNCYCDSYRKIQGLKKNAFSSQSKYSKDLMNGAFMKNKDIRHIHSSSLSLSLCIFSFSRSQIFSLSRSLTHTIFLHLSQIFKANIILHFVAMKIKGGTEDCFPVFVSFS